MVPKKLPSSCGLPSSWNHDMELSLGFLEARDETRNLWDVVKTLKREFPDLADYVITVESLLQWLQWLDWQEGPRGDSYRAGITAGQALVLTSLNAKGLELDPMDFDKYIKPASNGMSVHPLLLTHFKISIISSGLQASPGVRLVDHEDGIDDGVHDAAGGLEFNMTANHSSSGTPGRSHYPTSHHHGNATPTSITTPTSIGIDDLQSHDPDSSSPGQGTTAANEDNLGSHWHGMKPSPSFSPSFMTQGTSASITSASLHVPNVASHHPYLFTRTPSATSNHQQRTTSGDNRPYPQRSDSANVHTAAKFTRLASSGSVVDTPPKPRAISTTNSKSSLGSGSGLRERRQLGELNVGVAPSSHLVTQLPQVKGKENAQSHVTPANTSADRASLRDWMKTKIAGK